MVNFENKSKYDVYDLKKLIALLRAPGGCPWDAEQTHESIRRNFLEEAYEAVEAIDEKNVEHLREELGDVLMQVIFHAGMEEDAGTFDLDDAADAACRKLILRHPHVFGDTKVSGSEEVLKNWDEIKRVEKSQKTVTDSINSVAKNLPALWRAEKIQKKAAKAGVDWEGQWDGMDSLSEALVGLSEALSSGEGTAEALGRLLFSAVGIARFAGVDPEEALAGACDAFTGGFARAEQENALTGLSPDELLQQKQEADF